MNSHTVIAQLDDGDDHWELVSYGPSHRWLEIDYYEENLDGGHELVAQMAFPRAIAHQIAEALTNLVDEVAP